MCLFTPAVIFSHKESSAAFQTPTNFFAYALRYCHQAYSQRLLSKNVPLQ